MKIGHNVNKDFSYLLIALKMFTIIIIIIIIIITTPKQRALLLLPKIRPSGPTTIIARC